MMNRDRVTRVTALAVCLQLTACASCHPTPAPPPPPWQVSAARLPEALLSVSGNSATNVWAVGADLGRGPLVMHYDGSNWSRLDTAHHGHLWWVHVFEGGTWMSGGANGSIVRYDGTAVTAMNTPGLGRDTVFGLWGRSPTDVYAVGGFAGRSGFIWHYEGTTWSRLVLPADIPLQENGDIPGFFKVWGDQVGHVWVVGGHGLILRSDDGVSFSVVPSGVTSTLFTVSGALDATGAAKAITVVGGLGEGVILEAGPDGVFAPRAPDATGLVQGVSMSATGEGCATGQNGSVYLRTDGGWALDDSAPLVQVQSLHAAWVDPGGGLWAVGGNVLDTSLAAGALVHRGADAGTFDAPLPDAGTPPTPTCPAASIDPAPAGSSIARRWNELLIDAIRRDIPRPPVHARNLYHVSAALYDAWASYDTVADGVFFRERHTATDVDLARTEALSYAAYRVLAYRYAPSRAVQPGAGVSQACFRAMMARLGYDPDDTTATGDGPRAVGNRIGAAVISMTTGDGANETENYKDTTGWMAKNPPLVVDEPGVKLPFPSFWQQLNLFEAQTQNGIVLPSGIQGYIGSNAGLVTPFALGPKRSDGLYLDPETVPTFDDASVQVWAREVLEAQAALDVEGGMFDISPGRYGNNPLGTNDGTGHAMNPVTGAPYAMNLVPRGDFTRVLAEFWADGPKSETPPGHWNTLANAVADHPMRPKKLYGQGPDLSPLEWDVKVYLAINGAAHDAAIVAWGVKRAFSGLRPISVVRHMAGLGQSSDMALPSYHPKGLPLTPGVIELITAQSAARGQRHQHLARFVGQVAVRGWPGEPSDRSLETTPIQWMRGVDWVPYQRRNFVTPAFPGYVSGHSTFSRAAAEVLVVLTGSAFFPGGLGEFSAKKGAYLVFEDGPSVDVTLQWATYFDASDQAGQSRVYGGIHITPDDFAGRRMGQRVGELAAARAQAFFDGSAVP